MCSLWVYIFGPIKCEQQGNYPSGCFIQLASDTNISHATWVTTLLLKQPIFFLVIHYTMYVQLKWLKRSSVCNVLWSYISYVLSLQTAQQCQSASSSKGEREKSIFPKRLAPNTTILASFILEDVTGDKIHNLERRYREDAERINTEILHEWVAWRGKQPVTWETLAEVLRDVELHTLASDIEAVKSL